MQILRKIEENKQFKAEWTIKNNQCVIDITNENNPENIIWDLAFIQTYKEKNTWVLKYAPLKQELRVEDTKKIDQLFEAYPFLNNQNKWNDKRSFIGSTTFIVGIVISLVLAIYFFMIPWLAGLISSMISIEKEIELGNMLYEQTIKEYTIDEEKTKQLQYFINEIDWNTQYPIKVTVVKMKELNAFAMPGGNIVVFDSLLKTIKHYDELAALLSHEVTHVEKRHSLKSLARSLSGRIFLYLILGDNATFIDVSSNLTELNYSRALEYEADAFGFEILEKNKINPQGMIRLFEKFKNAENKAESKLLSFLSTHPVTDDRIKNTQLLIKNSPYQHEIDAVLMKIFEEINK